MTGQIYHYHSGLAKLCSDVLILSEYVIEDLPGFAVEKGKGKIHPQKFESTGKNEKNTAGQSIKLQNDQKIL